MKYKVGDRVAFRFIRHSLDSGALLLFACDFLMKGEITKVKTHDLFFFKRKNIKYKVCGIWVSERILKPIYTCK